MYNGNRRVKIGIPSLSFFSFVSSRVLAPPHLPHHTFQVCIIFKGNNLISFFSLSSPTHPVTLLLVNSPFSFSTSITSTLPTQPPRNTLNTINTLNSLLNLLYPLPIMYQPFTHSNHLSTNAHLFTLSYRSPLITNGLKTSWSC